MGIFIVIEVFPPDGEENLHSREIIRGYVEAEDVTDAEKRFHPHLNHSKDGVYHLKAGTLLHLRRIEKILWFSHPGMVE